LGNVDRLIGIHTIIINLLKVERFELDCFLYISVVLKPSLRIISPVVGGEMQVSLENTSSSMEAR